MKILINFLSARSGGAVSYFKNILEHIKKNNLSKFQHSITALVYNDQKQLIPFWPDRQCIIVPGRHKSGARRLLWEYRNLNKILKRNQVDVLFTPYQIGTKVTSAKHVMMIRNMEPFNFIKYHYSPKTYLRNLILKTQTLSSLRAADKVVAVSDYTEKFITESLGGMDKKVYRIYHGRDIRFNPLDPDGADQDRLKQIGIKRNFVLACGSLLPYRRSEDVLRAFNRFSQVHTKIDLVVAGSGNDRKYNNKLNKLIQMSSASDRIHKVGHVPVKAMQSLYRKCKFCVVSTEIEACPNIVIEAMASGCICISSDHPPLPEMFQNSSIQYKARDTKDLAAKMEMCLFDENLRKELKEKALQRAKDFSWETCAAETLKVLTQWR
ncbi:MAG: hypothetical protein CSA20_00760 [Deltaproteobacteria bacterium]|nr:MAG: hypothetical protein CSA20_00760 [Deltaproteobacteria bacterium]